VTSLAVLGFDSVTCRMRIESLHEGITREQTRANTGFELGALEPLGYTAPPTADQLEVLRNEVDPHGYILGRRAP
jgi:glutaconate CoA-transferase subunit B